MGTIAARPLISLTIWKIAREGGRQIWQPVHLTGDGLKRELLERWWKWQFRQRYECTLRVSSLFRLPAARTRYTEDSMFRCLLFSKFSVLPKLIFCKELVKFGAFFFMARWNSVFIRTSPKWRHIFQCSLKPHLPNGLLLGFCQLDLRPKSSKSLA